MVEANPAHEVHILIYEPRVEGHHLGYLKVITEELLAAGYRLSLAVDQNPEPFAQIRAELADVLGRITFISAGKASIDRIAALSVETKADFVFLPNLDEIGSAMLRRAAFGSVPPDSLRGRLGGIYHRPRFLGPLGFSFNQRIKASGFARLLRGGWFSHLLLVDPYLHAKLKARAADAPAFFLPDFFPANFKADRTAARQKFGLPEDKRVFLFYGAGYRRKGLALTVRAMLAMNADTPAYLLCAGRQADDREVARGLERLIGQGRAAVINRYVTNDEEKELFAASDVVLLPYRKHFGISGVLMRAIGAGLPVIVSDEQLLGRLVREHGLGILFDSGDANALQRAIEYAATAADQEMSRWQAAVHAAAPHWTRDAFRRALIASFDDATRLLAARFGTQ